MFPLQATNKIVEIIWKSTNLLISFMLDRIDDTPSDCLFLILVGTSKQDTLECKMAFHTFWSRISHQRLTKIAASKGGCPGFKQINFLIAALSEKKTQVTQVVNVPRDSTLHLIPDELQGAFSDEDMMRCCICFYTQCSDHQGTNSRWQIEKIRQI